MIARLGSTSIGTRQCQHFLKIFPLLYKLCFSKFDDFLGFSALVYYKWKRAWLLYNRGHIFFQTDPTMSTYLERQILLLLVWGIHSSWRVDLDSPCPLLYNGVTDQYKYTGAPKERKRNGRQIRITFLLIYIKCWIKGVTCILE